MSPNFVQWYIIENEILVRRIVLFGQLFGCNHGYFETGGLGLEKYFYLV